MVINEVIKVAHFCVTEDLETPQTCVKRAAIKKLEVILSGGSNVLNFNIIFNKNHELSLHAWEDILDLLDKSERKQYICVTTNRNVLLNPLHNLRTVPLSDCLSNL